MRVCTERKKITTVYKCLINKRQSNLVKGEIADQCCHLVNHKSSFRTSETNACFD